MRKFWVHIRWYVSSAIISLLSLVVAASPVRAAAPQFIGLPSSNWSGYAAYGNTFRQVQGEITVPRISCPTAGAEVLYWVGLDGDLANSRTVEQDGIGARCSSGRHPNVSYFAWWEMYPNPLQQPSSKTLEVAPGNKIIASVKFQAAFNEFTIKLQNVTTKKSYVKKVGCAVGQTCSRQSVEWITERYAINPEQRTYRPLAAWTQTSSPIFTNDQATAASGDEKMRPISHFRDNPLYMNNKTGQLLATASRLSPNGQSFSDIWQL